MNRIASRILVYRLVRINSKLEIVSGSLEIKFDCASSCIDLGIHYAVQALTEVPVRCTCNYSMVLINVLRMWWFYSRCATLKLLYISLILHQRTHIRLQAALLVSFWSFRDLKCDLYPVKSQVHNNIALFFITIIMVVKRSNML